MTGFCTRQATRHSAGTALIRGLCLLALLLPGLAAAAAAWPVLLAVHALGAAAPHGKRPAYPGLPQTMVWGQNGAHSGVAREPLHGSSAK